MGDHNAIDGIAFLAGSDTRVRILDALREGSRVERSDLQERLDCSRTTIGRNLDALEERGFIERTSDEVVITRVGEFVAEDFFDLVETVEAARTLEPFLKWAPPDEFDPALLRRLAEGELTVATPEEPYAPEDAHVERIRETEDHRLVLTVVGERAMEASQERLRAGDLTVELVIDPDIVDLFESHPRYAAGIQQIIDTERVDVFVHETDIPYYLGILDETVQLQAIDENGRLRAQIETDDEAVFEWAKRRYREYKRDAEPLDLTELAQKQEL